MLNFELARFSDSLNRQIDQLINTEGIWMPFARKMVGIIQIKIKANNDKFNIF